MERRIIDFIFNKHYAHEIIGDKADLFLYNWLFHQAYCKYTKERLDIITWNII
jgi:hypothetical protein